MAEVKIDYSNMSIWKKIQVVKKRILESNLKKSGENKFANFKYYELADFVPTIINLCEEVGLFTKFNFDNDTALLKIINCDKPDQIEEYTSPMRELELKGCNAIQALGGIETYSRRYLYMNAFDITENDMFDSNSGQSNVTTKTKETKATPKQIELLAKFYKEENLAKLLQANNITKLEELSIQKASELIKKISEKKEESK